MRREWRGFIWFVCVVIGILVSGTVAIAIPVAARSACSEMTRSEPPKCLQDTVPGLWAQSGQALGLAIACWLIASFVIPVLAAIAIRNESYPLGIIIVLSISCGLGYMVGDTWVNDRFPERYLATTKAAGVPFLGLLWTFCFTAPIISGMVQEITLEDLKRQTA